MYASKANHLEAPYSHQRQGEETNPGELAETLPLPVIIDGPKTQASSPQANAEVNDKETKHPCGNKPALKHVFQHTACV